MRIGLLGGSFNPAHAAHRHISLEALRRLDLDEVWWLVSPGNPLKSTADMASFSKRLARAVETARHPRIRVMDLERKLGTRYSADTLTALKTLMPHTELVWLMGADNLATFHHWRDWEAIFNAVPVAIFDRPHYFRRALSAKAARRFHAARVTETRARTLAGMKPPAWVFIHCPRHPLSATAIRARDASWLDKGQATDRQAASALKGENVQGLQESHSSHNSAKPESVMSLKTLVTDSLDQDKAEDIVTIDLTGKTSIADYMIIASGRSHRHVASLADHLLRRLKEAGHGSCRVEGQTQADWVLIDAGDVIIHLFRPEVRAFYNLEKMWSANIADDSAVN